MSSTALLPSLALNASNSSRLRTLRDWQTTLRLEDLSHDQCVICLQSLVDRTVIQHEFCFECISIWAGEPAPILLQ
ncbi:hypothetical protein DFJ58DRAFT_767591 [Suillus subalutaceus]|uniref:uncharacterized protein n=1 Tax=Suillus subalutaceus TaxID=48586 RepID=UPI001B87CEE3|nr:uncharacterized protein DFJ58DRAFT_767591 [Suillus subalutaceus]KAG1868358.1 hypothetical protein DFJ58DRAFT_767591 [Suillus subalutaceus]KAG1880966.1 hypothetical protein F4604DRAFT_1749079 [Suillus subluteus]